MLVLFFLWIIGGSLDYSLLSRDSYYFICFSLSIQFNVNMNLLQVAGVPGVTEALFIARQSALAEEKKKSDETPMRYSCGLCGKGYRSAKAHAQHLSSKSHLLRASKGVSNEDIETTIIKPLPQRVVTKPSQESEPEDEESEESEWEEADPEEDGLLEEATDSLTQMKVNEHTPMEEDESENDEYVKEINPSCCFMCDLEHDTIESCMVHMSKKHSFFIPDIEYLKDPKGFLTYLGLKVLSTPLSCFFYDSTSM